MEFSYRDRLKNIRKVLNEQQVDCFVQPTSDEFLGEYTPLFAQRLEWLTGFSGSAGLVCVVVDEQKKSPFFTDGRYMIQAAGQLDSGVYEIYNSADISFIAWVQKQKNNVRIAYDPMLHSHQQVALWKSHAGEHATWVALDTNPIDIVWSDQPALPCEPIMVHAMEYAGRSAEDKIAWLQEELGRMHMDACFIMQPDAINWLLNIRGADILYNPLFLCVAYIPASGDMIIGHYPRSIDTAIKTALPAVQWYDMPAFEAYIRAQASSKNIAVDGQHITEYWWNIFSAAGAGLIVSENPITVEKSIKNTTELQGMRDCHTHDGLALTQFLCWLDNAFTTGEDISELQAEEKLELLRAQQPHYQGASFATIAGAGDHGAIVHYRATESTNRVIGQNELFLCDSGGQYLDGTTDVTRTVVRGIPCEEMKHQYTLVLKGHIAIARAVFPAGTTGAQLDVLARQYLWAQGYDYDHGTGHGVGHFLCVHEGPQGISKRANTTALQPGMILSNEPGYYKAEEYGIRIENLVEVVEHPGFKRREKKFLTFSTLTLVPFESMLIDPEMLTREEKRWINAYHARVLEAHMQKLNNAERDWLIEKTRMY